mmetsp:Transcript_1079/g.954  ORF Transcript_1079/g.954 Transcript_1079/m.954 type:complete len:82 (+) Transcript_1079:431-676(+)
MLSPADNKDKENFQLCLWKKILLAIVAIFIIPLFAVTVFPIFVAKNKISDKTPYYNRKVINKAKTILNPFKFITVYILCLV